MVRTIHLGPWSFRLQESLVGSLFLGVITSIPELVVSLAAARLGAFDMALGNLLGSNIFNVTLLPVAQLLRPADAFWPLSDPIHTQMFAAAIGLSLVLAVGIRMKSRFAFFRLGWDGIVVCVAVVVEFFLAARAGIQF
jgi:cation:H+ antiporter